MTGSSSSLTGLSIAETSAPIRTLQQLGGTGTVYNTVLAVPAHLNRVEEGSNAPWHSVEYVLLPPATDEEVASVGEHVQATDEIYYLHRGSGELVTHDVAETVQAGSLVIAPRGTRHRIANVSTKAPLAFLVIELQAARTPQRFQPSIIASVPARLHRSEAFPALQGVRRVRLRIAQVDLAEVFSGPWGVLSLLELPPGARTRDWSLPTQDELLFVVAGKATFLVAGERIDPPEQQEAHRNVIVPCGLSRRISNRSSKDVLTILSVRVRREESPQPSHRHTFASRRAYQEGR